MKNESTRLSARQESKNKMITKSSKNTEALGKKVAKELKGGEIIYLTGNLGAGKTTFVKGLALGLGVKQNITSPTFVLFKPYQTKHKTIKQLVHADCYRITGKELLDLGIADYLGDPTTITVIEWAEKLPKKISSTINISIKPGKKTTERSITITKTLA